MTADQMTWHDYGDNNPRDGGLLNCCGVMVGLALAGMACVAAGAAVLCHSRHARSTAPKAGRR